jgi:hypothetical protein
VTRSGKDGAFVSEPLPPGEYLVRVEAHNMLNAETHLTVKIEIAATAEFKLEAIIRVLCVSRASSQPM